MSIVDLTVVDGQSVHRYEALAVGWSPMDGNLFYKTPFDGELTPNQIARLADVRRMQMQRLENNLRFIIGLRPEDV
jgi:hypothetical protein